MNGNQTRYFFHGDGYGLVSGALIDLIVFDFIPQDIVTREINFDGRYTSVSDRVNQ